MYTVRLINMPFADVQLPSLGLMQLKARLAHAFDRRVSCNVLYLNNDFAQYLGLDVYTHIVASTALQVAGLGDWYFRQVAFPREHDNDREYFRRYCNGKDEKTVHLRERLRATRPGLEAFLESLIDKYELRDVDLVGLTSMFSQNVACFALARLLKRGSRPPHIVMGGANCEAPMGKVIAENVESIDAVFSGPALKSFISYVGARLDGEAPDVGAIGGIFTRTPPPLQCGRGLLTVIQPPRPTFGEELDINTVIEPDYDEFLDQFSISFPGGPLKPYLTFETSRGCWWGAKAHCTFCGLNGSAMTYRALDSDKAIAQFQRLFKYANRCAFLESVDNIMPTNYPTEVLPFLDTPPQVKIFYEVKADLSDETIATLARAGVRVVQPGIESIATSTLKLMRKGTNAFGNLSFLKSCLRHRVSPIWNLLIGFPGEEPAVYEKYLKDIPLLVHLPPPTGVFPIRFDRYSPYFTKAHEYGLALKPMEFYGLVYPFKPEALADLAYYFIDTEPDAAYLFNMAEWHGVLDEAVSRWKRLWANADASTRPVLRVTDCDGVMVVHDSRSEAATTYALTAEQWACLMHLNRPTRTSDLREVTKRVPTIVPEREVDFLRARGLVFQEGDRIVNLLCDGVEVSALAARERLDSQTVAVAACDAHEPAASCCR
jgi:magnesium-protoporphyrin IX monomethyl ester (oxidative) cyclase